jgi:hypothetical protein
MVTIEPVKKKTPDFLKTADTKEWFDSVGSAETGSIELPEPNADYGYAATRAFAFWPVVNSRGATYEREDFDDENLGTFLGVQANLLHDKKQVIGTVFAYQPTAHGIDVGVRVDREQADMHGMDVRDMKPGMDFSRVSVELTKDPALNTYYVYKDDGTIVHKIPVLKGREMGLRRTTEGDPYRYQGMKVAERIKPLRFTGLGFVPNPADVTAELYKVAASADSEEAAKLNLAKTTHEHADNSAALLHKEITMTSEEKAALESKVTSLEAALASITSAKEAASAEATTAAAKITELEEKLAALTTELASATSERDTLKSEKETAAKTSRIDALVTELEAILAPADDAAKTALREQASAAVDDEKEVRLIKAERTAAAATAKLAEIEKASNETPEAKAEREAKEKAAADEAAKVEKEKFNAETPSIPIAPGFTVAAADGKTKSISREEALKHF